MVTHSSRVRLAALAAAALFAGLASGLLTPAFADPPVTPAASARAAVVLRPPYAGARSQRGERYYALLYGVDQLEVRSTASGSSLEFRYRVLDAQKAAMLADKRVKPYLIDQKTQTRLTVPTMEKIGALRQTATLEEGREYWMVFGNPGKRVKPGERVDVVIGAFRVSSLTVQ